VSGVQQVVLSGPLILAVPIAAAAGAITFISPCCLPLVPGYLAYATGMSGTDAQTGGRAARRKDRRAALASGTAQTAGDSRDGAAGSTGPGSTQVAVEAPPAGGEPPQAARPGRGRTMAGTLLFVLGFSAVFATYGAASGSLGGLLAHHQDAVIKVLGAVTIVLGLLFAGIFDRFSFAGRVIRPSIRPRAGLAGAPLLGVMFGIGWTPCIGPTLATVLALSTTTGTAGRGAFLAFVYGLGLGVPFLIVSMAFQRSMRVFAYARRHARLVTRIGGALLVVVGVLEVTGAWATAMTWMKIHWIGGYQPPL
jgi:cytochrome c-type biogenesis protein